MSIVDSLQHLMLTLKTHHTLEQEGEIILYVPKNVFQKLALELAEIQRVLDPSKRDSNEIELFGLFKIREAWELEYLERTIDDVRRAVR